MNNLVKGGIVAGGLMVGAAALVIGAGMAHADSGEDQSGFITALHDDGFGSFPVDEAVTAGERICRMMQSGESQHEVIVWLENPPRPIAATVAIDLVVDAHVYLCPQIPDGGGSSPAPGSTVAGWTQRHHR